MSTIDVGKCVRMAQLKMGVRSSELADRMGVVRQQMTRWRYAKTLQVERANQIAQALGMTLTELLELGE